MPLRYRHIHIDSKDRINGSTTDFQVKIRNLEATAGLLVEGSVESVAIPNSLYTIEINKNDRISVKIIDGAIISLVTAVIPEGFYDIGSLATAIANELTSESGKTFTMTFDTRTGKYTLSIANPFFFQTLVYDERNIRLYNMLGFPLEDPIESVAVVGTGLVNLVPYKNIYIVTDLVAESDYLTAPNTSSILTKLNVNSLYTSASLYNITSGSDSTYKRINNGNNVHSIRLINEFGEVIDLQDRDWNMTISIKVYEQTPKHEDPQMTKMIDLLEELVKKSSGTRQTTRRVK